MAEAENQKQLGCFGWILVVLVISAIGNTIWGDDDGDSSSSGDSPVAAAGSSGDSDEDEYGAYQACKEFVRDRLRAPSTASFPDYFDFDDEIVISHTGNEYTIVSQVDSQNGFGAMLTAPWTCTVTDTGSTWRLQDVFIVE